MKKMFLLVAASIAFTGCAGTSVSVVPAENLSALRAKTLGLVDKASLLEANRLLDDEDSEGALSIYEDLLDRADGLPESVQRGLLTNAALACLQQADRAKFLHYAERLSRESLTATRLPKNAQFVLLVADEFEGKSGQRDLRLNVNMQQAVSTVVHGK